MEKKHTLSPDEQKIYAVLTTGKSNKLNLCVAIHSIITSAEEDAIPGLLQYTCENFKILESSKEVGFEVTPINDNEKEKLKDQYGKISDEMLNSLVALNLEEDEFYRKVWQIILNPFFSTSNAQSFVFYNILVDSQIPYFHVSNGLMMANDEFKVTMEEISNETAKAKFILKRHFEQSTQRASNLITLLDSLKGNKKTVLMAYILLLKDADRENLIRAFQQGS